MRQLQVLVVMMWFLGACHAAQVVLIGNHPAHLRQQVEVAANFYGLELSSHTVENPANANQLLKTLKQEETIAVIASTDVLPRLNRATIQTALERNGRQSIPILIVESGEVNNAPSVSAEWSGGDIRSCKSQDLSATKWQLHIQKTGLLSPLSGLTLPFTGKIGCAFELGSSSTGTVLIEASQGQQRFPAFVFSQRNGRQLFFLAGMLPQQEEHPQAGEYAIMVANFAKIAPVMTFLRRAAGEKGWHAPVHYANLTVDDPWLTEPYGNLRYSELTQEMKVHNFHTTVAFIPWNFDRSEPSVVTLFRQNPDRLSVAIHGNNHNHREFEDYTKAPLATQKANLGQALARMERFSQLTGIQYSPVMVFPHAIAPAETFRAMKADNYWATVNSQNVPLGSKAPADPSFWMRSQTLAFNNFPSLKRYSVEIPLPNEVVAINAFLDNPQLFYTHHQYFYPSIGVFNETADYVNRIEPTIQWRSIGEVTQHLYLVRLREDEGYDLQAFTSDFVIHNTEQRDRIFHVQKIEDFTPPINSLSVDGEALSYEQQADSIVFNLSVQAGRTRHVRITYSNDLDVTNISTVKPNFVVNTLRTLSDFRDITLARSDVGRRIVAFYSQHSADALNIRSRRTVIALSMLILTFTGGLLYFRKKG